MVCSDATLQVMLTMQLEEVKHGGNYHLAQYKPEHVFRMLNEVSNLKLCERTVKKSSHRYEVFKHSLICADCGLEGTIMCLDVKRKYFKSAHFNLYGITPSGRVVMFTKDHIVARTNGGCNRMDNYQTMCETCNCRKGSK